MPQIALVVLGLFVLVWIISAVVKASQDTGPRPRPGGPANRPRPVNEGQRIERTSDTDIDRFMAEIDRLRRRGEGGPAAARPAEAPRPVQRPLAERPTTVRPEPRPRPGERREKDRERERRVRQTQRPAPPPPPPESVPVLRPIELEDAAPMVSKPLRPAKPSTTAATTVNTGVQRTPNSPVLLALHSMLASPQGPAAALILAEIFSEAPGKRALRLQAPPPSTPPTAES